MWNFFPTFSRFNCKIFPVVLYYIIFLQILLQFSFQKFIGEILRISSPSCYKHAKEQKGSGDFFLLFF